MSQARQLPSTAHMFADISSSRLSKGTHGEHPYLLSLTLPCSEDKIHALRNALLVHGAHGSNADETRSIRELVWPQLLDIETTNTAAEFARFVSIADPSSHVESQVERDLRPTLKQSPEVQAICTKKELQDLLYAYDSWCKEQCTITSKYKQVRGVSQGYIQGMGRVAAVLCLTLPLHLVWACLCKLFSDVMPGWYTLSNHLGTALGNQLLDEVLIAVDPQLRKHIVSCFIPDYATLTAASRIYCIFGQTTPTSATLPLYDAILCIGPHFVVPLIVAEIVISRDRILAEPKPRKVLDITKLACDADTMVSTAVALLQQLPKSLRQRLEAWPLQTSTSRQAGTPEATATAAAAAGTSSTTSPHGMQPVQHISPSGLSGGQGAATFTGGVHQPPPPSTSSGHPPTQAEQRSRRSST